NQLAIDMDMPLRVIGYDGSSYRDEMNQDEIVIDEETGKKHKIRHKRYPVVTIVLYFGKVPWKKPLNLYDVLEISDDLKPFVNDYKINLIDVPRLTEEQVEKFTSDFQIIADYFVQLNENKGYVPKDITIRHTDSFLKLMSVLTQDDKYVEIYRELSHEKEEFNMCEVLDKVEARGKAIGALNKTVEILRVIIAKNSWSKEQAMEFIGIPRSEFAKYAALL
ncbi:MAG: Rpn family recombination-promoting nuclease/putative transposase, partial [Veillonellaceae bacterium]|nr:Rpn family recombination-promoting nuclease/putative transposase [Veillonellaceae bacterium]